MEDRELDDLLRDHFEREALDHAFVAASGWTDRCLSVPRLVEVSRQGLTKEERDHTNSCRYCQKAIAVNYHEECPPAGMLLRYLLGQSGLERAIEAHLDRDGCTHCQSKLDSGALVLLKRLIEAGKLVRDTMAVSFVPPFPFALQAAPDKPVEPFQHSAKGPNGLHAWLRTESGELRLRIRTENPAEVGRTVFVMVVLAEGEPLKAEFALEQYTIRKDGQPAQIAMAEHSFGPYGDLAQALSKGFGLIFDFAQPADPEV